MQNESNAQEDSILGTEEHGKTYDLWRAGDSAGENDGGYERRTTSDDQAVDRSPLDAFASFKTERHPEGCLAGEQSVCKSKIRSRESDRHETSSCSQRIPQQDSTDKTERFNEDNRMRGGCGGSRQGTQFLHSRDRRPESSRSRTLEGHSCECSRIAQDRTSPRDSSTAGTLRSTDPPRSRDRRIESPRNRSPEGHSCGCNRVPQDRRSSREVSLERTWRSTDTCPPREVDPCHEEVHHATNAACSSPCTNNRGCCPPSGSRPVCRKPERRRSPCTGEAQGCGGGGCCGGGCRGGCGKPGQICMPSRPCTVPPSRSCPSTGSPCSLPANSGLAAWSKTCPTRGVGNCGAMEHRREERHVGGHFRSSSYCRSKSPRQRNNGDGWCCNNDGARLGTDGADVACCRPKLPVGCECLGGGPDCQRCGRKVYQAEMQIASGVPYHNICFSCFCCRKPLEPLTYQENCGEIYCKR
ncbi:hypothetical protein KM043_012902 [Ampulex compressa]|nr:hypothetical protein KM043_012902 [Ampulex compressa]